MYFITVVINFIHNFNYYRVPGIMREYLSYITADEEAILEEYGPLPSQVLNESFISTDLQFDSEVITTYLLNLRTRKLLNKFPKLSNKPSGGSNSAMGIKTSVTASKGGSSIDCDRRATVANYPSISIETFYSEPMPSVDLTRPPPSQPQHGPPSQPQQALLAPLDIMSRQHANIPFPPSLRPIDLATLISQPLPTWG